GDRPWHLPHPNAGCTAAGHSGLARTPDSVSAASRQARGVCRPGAGDRREHHAQWHDHPARRRHPHAAEMSAVDRDVVEYDVVGVGAGPAGLACAIRLKQLKPDLAVCVLEKGATVGAHSLSGAVMEPGPLDTLAPEWRDSPPTMCTPAVRDEFRLLTKT